MKVKDRVYGKVEITEPVIVDLIKTKTLQRLKGIDQAGYSKAFFPGTAQTRFEHSVGVYYLLKKFGVSLEEQIAGLIHDISHSAFSHSIDYIFGKTEKDQSHQDSIFEEFVRESTLPRVFKRYRIDLDRVIHLENYPLLDADIPDLSADRLDYSLRTAVAFSLITAETAMEFITHLTIHKAHWVFTTFPMARRFADLFLVLNRTLYSGPTSAVMFRTVGDCIGYAVRKGYITRDDLYTTDREVLKKVKAYLSQNRELMNFWNRMNNKIAYSFTKKNHNAHVFCKSRIVDPLYMDGNRVARVSDRDHRWKKIVAEELLPKEYFIRFVS